MEEGLSLFENKADIALKAYAETAAKKVESYAKTHAIWEDRTGDARKRLTGSVIHSSRGYKIKIAHGVNYGKWLELANEKLYSICKPSIDAMSPEVLRGMNKLLERLG